MFGAETCSEGSSTNTKPRRDQGRIRFPAPSASAAAVGPVSARQTRSSLSLSPTDVASAAQRSILEPSPGTQEIRRESKTRSVSRFRQTATATRCFEGREVRALARARARLSPGRGEATRPPNGQRLGPRSAAHRTCSRSVRARTTSVVAIRAKRRPIASRTFTLEWRCARPALTSSPASRRRRRP
jgi:hypothetical protein